VRWGIDRCGQKVQCIQDEMLWQFVCWELPCWPHLDAVYTVSGFGEIEGHPGVHLREISGVTCACTGLNNAPWPIEIFRPLDARQTDIGELTKILDTGGNTNVEPGPRYTVDATLAVTTIGPVDGGEASTKNFNGRATCSANNSRFFRNDHEARHGHAFLVTGRLLFKQ
jgi:hypothetical protein